jgi:hypothetical protein
MKNNTENVVATGIGFFGCVTLILVYCIPVYFLTFWTQSNINQLLVMAGKTDQCPTWLAAIPSVVFFPVTLVLNIITEIIQLFL